MQLQQERKGTSPGAPLDVAGAKETLTKEVEVRGKPLFCSTENLHCGFLAAGVTSPHGIHCFLGLLAFFPWFLRSFMS